MQKVFMDKLKLEVCAFNIQACEIAHAVGAARVELCDNPIEGGTTPSYGVIKKVKERVPILLYPIIRPRAGNYFYNDEEWEIIQEDILICKELGCDGISIGVQTVDGNIDIKRFKKIVELAGPMGVTCNRVFDNAPDPFRALEEIIDCGCERILTSGQRSAAPDGADLLAKLVEQAGDRIIIMPGAGVRSSNLRKLITETGAKEYHTSARIAAPNPVQFINKEVSDYGNLFIPDENELKAVVSILKSS
jgi:copper homeostasis protein